ncbi:MAG: ShlB/FhaC/HecB family hemolysin secretion/activation protein [Proteobacteria bacterium]|nr:ShlB/FhaC/HecB family hemolysin secretion/activation protein [Pseudomonadota bacterium]
MRNLLIVLSLLFLSDLSIAGPLGLPDSARPGAVRPQPEIAPEKSPVPAGDIVDIPAVIDRPFDLEEGPFVSVKEFRLLDAEDLPKFGVSIDEIQNTILNKLKEDQPEQGFSIGNLQEVADAVTRYYRSKGLILSTAVIPVQTVSGGIVDIQIFIGRLGRVLAESHEKYSEEVLRKPFLHLVGEPVTQETTEAALLTLTDYPGLSVFGVFQPGQKVGEADIVLKVQEEKWYDVAYRADNHGLQETGRNRFRTTVDWNNPTGGADKISATYQQTYNPKNNDYWSLDYQRFLGRGFTFGAGAYKNRFDIGGTFASSLIAAETTNQSIYLSKSFIRSRQKNLSGDVSLARKVSRTTTNSAQTNIDRLAVLAIELNFDSVDTFHPFRPIVQLFSKDTSENFGGGLNFATVTYSRGFNDILGAMGSSGDQIAGPAQSRTSRRGNEANELASGQFDKISANYQRLQLITKNQSLLFKTEFQWSNDILAALEQYSVGGPENVRGFPDAQGLFDRAYFFSFEYIFNAPFIADKPAFKNRTWGELLQFSVFYDFAMGQQNDAINTATDRNTSGSWVNFKSVGMGLRFNLPGSIDSRLMWATELGADVPSDGRQSHIWGDFTYSF